MIPELQVYYDFSRNPPPEVLSWLEEMGVPAKHRSSLEAPQEWLQRYGCCFPWVVIEERIQLKAGFKKSQLERLLRRWKGAPKLAVTTVTESPQAVSGSFHSQNGPDEVQELHRALAVYYSHLLDDLAVSKTFLLDSETSAIASPNASNESISKLPDLSLVLPRWEVDSTTCRQKDRLSENFFLNSFRGGLGPIVLVHPDCEGLTPAIIEQAIFHLRNFDIVVGSTTAGNCYLLGLRSWHEALFYLESNNALPECSVRIKARARTLGLSIEELPTLKGILSCDDLRRLTQKIRQQKSCGDSRSEKVCEYLLDVCDRILTKTSKKDESADTNTRSQSS